mgnify:CR=1 FL=1
MFAKRLVATTVTAVAFAVAAAAATVPAQAADSGKQITFQITVHQVPTDVHDLPGGVTYGQGRLAGSTTWAKQTAKVQWMCSHVSTNGVGPAHDLVTITRADGAVLALSLHGRINGDALRGTVDVIGGKGPHRGASGNGTVVGSPGQATISVTVTTGGSTRAVALKGGVGC